MSRCWSTWRRLPIARRIGAPSVRSDSAPTAASRANNASTIAFPNGATVELRADSETLDVRLAVPEDGDVARMEEVVASHLDSFAFREAPLTFDWREV